MQIEEARQSIRIGRWTARWLHGGLYLDYDHIPLTRGGLVQLFAPNYARGYYGSGSNPPPATVEELPDGGRSFRAVFHYTEESRRFDATQTVEVHPDNRVVYTIHAQWEGQDPAMMEWNPLRLWAYPLIGASYEAYSVSGPPVRGRIGYRPLPGSYPATRLSPPWTTLALQQTAVGTVTLTGQVTSEGPPEGPILYDGREDPYLQEEKQFWGGYPGLNMKPGQEITCSLTLQITPSSPTPPAQQKASNSLPMPLDPAIRPSPAAQEGLLPLQDRDGHPVIIPQPKQATFPTGDYVLRDALPITAVGLNGPEGQRVRAELERFTTMLRRDARLPIGVTQSAWRGRGLLVAIAGRGGRIYPQQPPQPGGQGGTRGLKRLLQRQTLLDSVLLPATPDHAEGYALRVTPQYIAVVGSDAAGAYYGMQTLRQLLRWEAGGRCEVKGATITDWPSLAFRGAHIFVGRDALPFHKTLIERIFSRYKLNKLVIECEYTAWRSHPEIHVDYAMSPEDLKADVDYARDHFLEPIPLVNSLGHSQWIFANGQHRDIVEDARVPYAYDAGNPDTYRFLFDVYQETLDIFHPRLFHIGHDEVKIPGSDAFGQYPARPENRRKGITRLFVEDTNRLADWLRRRGVRTMLWGDMLLHESEGTAQPGIPVLTAANATSLAEARARRTQIPGDAIVADWRYEAGSEQRNGLATLKRAGFDTVGCAWYEPENIRGWAQQALQSGALGTLQTTWAGYNSNENLLESEYKQFTAYVLAAEYAWSGSTLHPRTGAAAIEAALGRAGQQTNLLPYTAEDVFARSYRDTACGGPAHPGWLLLPGRSANIQLRDDGTDGFPWVAIPVAIPPVAVPLVAVPLVAVPLVAVPLVAVPTNGQVAQPGAGNAPIDIVHDPETGIALPSLPQTGILLHGVLPLAPGVPALPAAIRLPIDRRARTLAFLHATACGVAYKTAVGAYTVVYADGKREEIPLSYGFEIRALDDHTPSGSFSTTAVTRRYGNGPPLTLRLLQWTNPHPNVPISSVELRADDALSAPILFSITGIGRD
jgi:uncharacterized protein YndB with AHSA1/START domain